LPDRRFLFGGHEYPITNLDQSATATFADFIVQSRANTNARGIGFGIANQQGVSAANGVIGI
jgi:hypothetical protein